MSRIVQWCLASLVLLTPPAMAGFTFRDLESGDQLEDIEGLELVEELHGNRAVYQRPSDKMEVGHLEVRRILYSFIDSQLYGVQVMLRDPECEMANIATVKFGAYTRANYYDEMLLPDYREERVWVSQEENLTLHVWCPLAMDTHSVYTWFDNAILYKGAVNDL